MSLFTSIPKKWLILPAFILLVFPISAFADVSQGDYSSSFSKTSSLTQAQQLGTLFSGSLTDWSIYVTGSGQPFVSVALYEYASCTDVSSGTLLSISQADSHTYVSNVMNFHRNTPIPLNSSSCYFLVFTNNNLGGSNSAVIYGSSSNTWAGGNMLSNGASISGTPLTSNLTVNVSSSPVTDMYFVLQGIAGGGIDTRTRIDSVDPAEGDNVSTTTPIYLGAIGYINSSYGDFTNVDHNEGIQVKWNVYSNAQTNNCIDVLCTVGGGGGVAGVNYYSGTGFSAFSAQDFSVSALMDSNLATGYYTLTTSIIKPSSFFGLSSIFGIGFGEDIIVATTTQFTAGVPSAGQTALNEIYNATKAGVAGLTATSSAVSLDSCNLFTFDIGTCLAVLFLPSASDMQNTIQFAKDNILSRAPWGYATRMVAILTNNATTTISTALPTWTVTFPSIQGVSGSPLAGTSIVFDMQDMLNQGSTTLNGITDPISGKSVREIVEPYILLFIAISALIIMFHDVMGMGHHTNKYADN